MKAIDWAINIASGLLLGCAFGLLPGLKLHGDIGWSWAACLAPIWGTAALLLTVVLGVAGAVAWSAWRIGRAVVR